MAIDIKFDLTNNPEAPTIILAKRNSKKLGLLHVDEKSIDLKDKFNDAPEFSFTLYKYEENGEITNLWDEVVDFKLVWCKEWDKWFEINVELDEASETIKTVFCTQLGQAELSQIKLYNIHINDEEDVSRDDYDTEFPTILYRTDGHTEASLLHRLLKDKAPHYSILHVDSTIANIQRTFSFDDTTIYDAFQEIAEELGCLFVFHSGSDENGKIQRAISVYDLQQNCNACGHRGEFTDFCPKCNSDNIKYGYGEDTSIFVTSDELASDGIQLTTDKDSVKNCFKLEAGDDLMTATIRNCNPNGTDYIWRFSDDTKADMSDELRDKLNEYDDLCNYYKNDYVIDVENGALIALNKNESKIFTVGKDINIGDILIFKCLTSDTSNPRATVSFITEDGDIELIQILDLDGTVEGNYRVSKLIVSDDYQSIHVTSFINAYIDLYGMYNDIVIKYQKYNDSLETIPSNIKGYSASKSTNVSTSVERIYKWDRYSVVYSEWEYTREELGTAKPTDITSQSYSSYSITDDGYFELSGNIGVVTAYYYINGGDKKSIYLSHQPLGSDVKTYYKMTVVDDRTQSKGEIIDNVTSSNSSAYPDDGIKNGYWYVKTGYTDVTVNLSDPIPLMNAYYNTIDLALYLQSGLMPSVEISETNAAQQAALLTEDSMSPVAVANIDTVSLSTANSSVLAMAKVIVKSTFKVEIKSSELSNNIWTGSFVVTNYSDENDTATSSTISIEINGDEESYVKQKIEKALGKDNTDDLSVTGLFEKEYDDFCAELKKYALNPLISFHDSAQACIDILIEQGIGVGAVDDYIPEIGGGNTGGTGGTGEDIGGNVTGGSTGENIGGNVTGGTGGTGGENNSNPNGHALYTKLYVPYYKKLKAIESEIKIREGEVNSIIGKYDKDGNLLCDGMQTYIEKCKKQIQDALNFQKYLEKDDLWIEFCSYRREDKYSNSNYISDGLDNTELFAKANEFYDIAETEIYKASELQHSISTTLNNLLGIPKFKSLVKSFKVGNWIRVRIDEKIYRLRLLEYGINFGDFDNISVEFSDVTKIKNGITDVKNILSQASSMATSYSSVQRQASQGEKSNAIVSNWFSNGLSTTNTKIVGADNQNQVWDKNGILCRQYDPILDSYSDEQLKIINSTIAITDNDWETTKTAVGKYYYVDPVSGESKTAYGVNGETIVGKMILGESLGLYNANNSMSFDSNGLVVSNNTNKFVINPNNTSLLTAYKGNEATLSFDEDGDLIVSGTILAKKLVLDPDVKIEIKDDNNNVTSVSYVTVGGEIGDADGDNGGASGFLVDNKGKLTANGATINGTLKSENGTIGGFTIGKNGISYTGENDAANVYIGTGGIRTGNKLYLNNMCGIRGLKNGVSFDDALYDNSNCIAFVNNNDRVVLGHWNNSADTVVSSPNILYLKANGESGDDGRCTLRLYHDITAGKVFSYFQPSRQSLDSSTNEHVSYANLGGSGRRWNDIYAVNGSIITSDRNAKKDIEPLDDKYVKMFDMIEPVSYAFKSGNRTHIGFIAQDVETAMENVGLTSMDFAGLCKDAKIVEDENGDKIEVLDDNGNQAMTYSLRYQEFIPLNTAKIKQLEKMIVQLKEEIELLKS